jgi:hypothetical protein
VEDAHAELFKLRLLRAVAEDVVAQALEAANLVGDADGNEAAPVGDLEALQRVVGMDAGDLAPCEKRGTAALSAPDTFGIDGEADAGTAQETPVELNNERKKEAFGDLRDARAGVGGGPCAISVGCFTSGSGSDIPSALSSPITNGGRSLWAQEKAPPSQTDGRARLL